jgi:hypothetical protein
LKSAIIDISLSFIVSILFVMFYLFAAQDYEERKAEKTETHQGEKENTNRGSEILQQHRMEKDKDSSNSQGYSLSALRRSISKEGAISNRPHKSDRIWRSEVRAREFTTTLFSLP